MDVLQAKGEQKSPLKTINNNLTAYELEREEKIKRNKIRLNSLNTKKFPDSGAKDDGERRVLEKKIKKRKEALVMLEPVRRSNRAGERKNYNEDDALKAILGISVAGTSYDVMGCDDFLTEIDGNHQEETFTCEEWCANQGLEQGFKVNGYFTGWVEESCRLELGIAASESALAHGGGSAKVKSAKERSLKSLYSNPNAYFYRHNKPGEVDRKSGQWSEDEIALFVEVAKKHGCGDKWGLFASHIPGRVGYACNAVYRQVILRRGLILDDNWCIPITGAAMPRRSARQG